MNFSNIGPFHGLQFFTSCSSMCPSHGVQSSRSRLLQCGSPVGSQALPAKLLQCGLLSTAAAPACVLHGLQLPSGHVHLLWRGSSTGCSVDIFSIIDLHGLQRDNLLQHGLLYGLQGNLSLGAWSISSPSFFSSPWCAQGCFSHIFLSLLSLPAAAQHFLPSLRYIVTEVPVIWLRGSAVPCGGSTGTSWNQLCLAQGSPSLLSQRSSLQLPPANTWALTHRTVIYEKIVVQKYFKISFLG